jgi:colicin import membrane protein
VTEQADQTTIEDAGAVGGFSTEVAEYTETAAALARLEFRMKDVVHDVTTTKGMDAAKKDVAELRTLRTSLDKKRLELNEDDQARIKRRNDEAKRITARIEELEDPIKEQIKVEVQRKEDEKIARAQREKDRQDALRTRIDTMAGLALRSVGKPSAYIAEKIALLEGMTTDDFEEMTPVAVNTKADTLAKLRELLAAAESHEQAVAELAESRRREEAQRAENERLERDARDAREKTEREARERQEAEVQAERDRQARARQEEDARRAVEEKARTRTNYINELVLNSVGQDVATIERNLAALYEVPKTAEVDTELVNADRRLTALMAERVNADRVAAEAAQREADRLAEVERARRAEEEQEDRVLLAAADKKRMRLSEIEGICQQVAIAQLGRAGVRRGGTVACMRETLAETEAWRVEASHFGDLYDVAVAAKRDALSAIRAMIDKAARSALEKAAPKMQELLAQTTIFLRTITEGPHAEDAKRLHDEIMTACGDLRPVLDDPA